jgi:DNA sulfur modification protein DndC
MASELISIGSAVVTASREVLERRYEDIRGVYLSDERPWVIGYSGGKDSTTALQMIWIALRGLGPEQLKKRIYVLSSDTLVETPKIVEYIDANLGRINRCALEQGLPITAHKVQPDIVDSFWVNIIGRGYPAPSKQFRWCTERLKIDPANRFILDRVAEAGEVVMILGVRRDESSTRAQVMSLHRIQGSPLSRHSTLPNAFVYTPIEDFTVQDVWIYLLQVGSPWGANNRDLVTLYRNAQAGECPLVVDKNTASCGNSRFGCWVCTVVNRDSSMEAMIENGEEWLTPLLDFRDFLASTQSPEIRGQIRKFKRRNGQVVEKDGVPQTFGPYTLEFRQELLRRLLQVQRTLGGRGTNSEGELISKQELEIIRSIWRAEEQDWKDSVPTIFRDVMGHDLSWVVEELPGFSHSEKDTLADLCRERDINPDLVSKLLETERRLHGMSRRSSIQQRIASIFEEDWRTDQDLKEQIEKKGHMASA